MAEMSAEEFAQLGSELELLDHRHLQQIWAEIGSRQVTCEEFQQILLRRAYLTNFQAEKLVRGDRAGYFYGDYKVLYLVGTGTFARVYRAVHKLTGEVVAVKVLRRRHAGDREQAERFLREGHMGATLRHPNIVPIHEVVGQGESYYLTMDFVEGRNLREFIKIRKKLDPTEATKLVADVAGALAYAFERGLFHRDLKLSNVLVSSRGEGMLVDFGLAAGDRERNEDSTAGNPRTIDYAGLERATGAKRDDPRSDIYFLGCIYYHILTGQSPIVETKDRMQRLSKTRFQSVLPILQIDPTIPKVLVPIVTKAMEFNPVYRYQSPQDMFNDLRLALPKLAEGEEEPAGPTPMERAKAAAASGASLRAIMLIESNVELQNIFRERLKSHGYRVLVTRDPNRAIDRFKDEPGVAECVIFSTGELGEPALQAYNQFLETPATAQIPAILLLGEQQRSWQADAKTDERHAVLSMPIKLRDFRTLMAKLLPPNEAEPAENTSVAG